MEVICVEECAPELLGERSADRRLARARHAAHDHCPREGVTAGVLGCCCGRGSCGRRDEPLHAKCAHALHRVRLYLAQGCKARTRPEGQPGPVGCYAVQPHPLGVGPHSARVGERRCDECAADPRLARGGGHVHPEELDEGLGGGGAPALLLAPVAPATSEACVVEVANDAADGPATLVVRHERPRRQRLPVVALEGAAAALGEPVGVVAAARVVRRAAELGGHRALEAEQRGHVALLARPNLAACHRALEAGRGTALGQTGDCVRSRARSSSERRVLAHASVLTRLASSS
ncbi:hypothetical protein T492DRAFT_938100, partial [Pavlovales sp. CCMP2436]